MKILVIEIAERETSIRKATDFLVIAGNRLIGINSSVYAVLYIMGRSIHETTTTTSRDERLVRRGEKRRYRFPFSVICTGCSTARKNRPFYRWIAVDRSIRSIGSFDHRGRRTLSQSLHQLEIERSKQFTTVEIVNINLRSLVAGSKLIFHRT